MSDEDMKWVPCSCGNKIGVPHSAWQGRKDGYARALEDAALAVERGCAHTKYENCYPCWHDQYAEKIRALRVQHG